MKHVYRRVERITEEHDPENDFDPQAPRVMWSSADNAYAILALLEEIETLNDRVSELQARVVELEN
jgi:hypothetical protein